MTEIIDRLASVARDRGLAAIVALSPENVRYTVGYMVPSHFRNRRRRTVSVVTASGESALLAVDVEAIEASKQAKVDRVHEYRQFDERPMTALVSILDSLGVTEGPLAIELDYLPALDYIELRDLIPRTEFVECRDIYLSNRMVKTAPELEILSRVAKISDLASQHAFGSIRAGMSEREVASIINAAALEHGADGLRLGLGSGPRSSIVNPKATSRRLERGDVVRIEVLAELDSYQSNVTRTGVVGPPTAEQQRIWRVLVDANARAREILAPGTPVKALWGVYYEHLTAHDIQPSLRFLGHGIGVTGHDEPYITADSELEIVANMVLTFEPFYMIEGQMGFQVENMFAVTSDGHVQLSDEQSNKTLIEIAV